MTRILNNDHQIANAVTNFLESYNDKHKLPPYKLKTLNAIEKCRTEYMGGHIESCTDCGSIRTAYNSCRNRHCPKCGAIDKEKWILSRETDLLPVKYFHVVFTVPDSLNELFMKNQKALYNLLFSSSWGVLNDFGQTKKWLGGKMGATAILHTWGQNLNYHPHIHFIVPAGAIMPNEKWKHSRKKGKYLFKVEQLSCVFRARFVSGLRKLKSKSDIEGCIPNSLFDKNWVVYAKQPFGGPEKVINYLGRYTHRAAISNDRILEVTNKKVTFSWKDYKNNYETKTTTLTGEDFLRLFCLHIMPPGFTRIRHYGFLSSASKKKSLAIIREFLGQQIPTRLSKEKSLQIVFQRMGINPGTCCCCGGNMVIVDTIRNKFKNRLRAPPCNDMFDSIIKTLASDS